MHILLEGIASAKDIDGVYTIILTGKSQTIQNAADSIASNIGGMN